MIYGIAADTREEAMDSFHLFLAYFGFLLLPLTRLCLALLVPKRGIGNRGKEQLVKILLCVYYFLYLGIQVDYISQLPLQLV